jgi:5'-nucleotidase
MIQPLILVTNDDGIASRGLWELVEAVLPLGEVLVVAPDRQWSGGGRSMPVDVTGHIEPASRIVNGTQVTAHQVDGSPALAVVHGVLELAVRRPALVVSGINFGANLGTEVTISGTIGAALEAGAFGIPSLAVSMEMDPEYHLTGDDTADYSAAKAMAQKFAWYLLSNEIEDKDVHAWNLNVPSDATPGTPWRLTCLARDRYYLPLAPDRANGQGRPGFKRVSSHTHLKRDSDIWAVKIDRVMSITPLSLDLTSRVDFCTLEPCLQAELMTHLDTGMGGSAVIAAADERWALA